jgi:outer membrane protein assembly factor BamB
MRFPRPAKSSFLPPSTWPAVLALLLSPSAAQSEDWPQFRGVNRDAVWNETGLLHAFPVEGLKILWRKPVGRGLSSPVVEQGRVFLTDAVFTQSAVKERIQCFSDRTGDLLWQYAYDVSYPDWAFNPENGTGPCATPIVSAGKVYTMGANGHLLCLDVRNGAPLWEKALDKEYKIGELSCRPSPLIDGNRLIVVTGAKPGACVMALDKDTGKEIWKSLDELVANSSPVIIVAGGKRQLIVWTGQSVTSLNPATGEVYWREPMTTSNNDDNATPVVEGNHLLVSGAMFALDPVRPAVELIWPASRVVSKRILSNTSNPVLKGRYVYSARTGGGLVCLEAATGKELWKVAPMTEAKNGASIQLTMNGEDAFLFTDNGDLILAQLTPEGYHEISRAHLLDPTMPFAGRKFAWAPPCFANRRVFARSDTELVCASLEATP